MVNVIGRSERGVALLVVILAIALMTIVVTDFAISTTLSHLSVSSRADRLRSYYLARSGVNVGLALLANDARFDEAQQQPYDGLGDLWAIPAPPVPLAGGVARLSVIDEARKLNINLLVNSTDGSINPQFVQTFTRLFTMLNVSPEVLSGIVDWLDADSVVSPGGAEDSYYLGLIPPYRPRNGQMPVIGDLRLVRGVDAATFELLRNFVTVAPELRVNANTAPAEVLASLTPELAANPNLVKAIIAARSLRPFFRVTDVANLPGMAPLANRLTQVLTTRSVYFTITGMGRYADARKHVYSMFRRDANGAATLISWWDD